MSLRFIAFADTYYIHKPLEIISNWQWHFNWIVINTCTQRPLAQVNSSERQVALHRLSSDPSEQSEFWSQTQDIGMHSPSELLHVNSSGVQTCFSVERILIALLFQMLNIYKRDETKWNEMNRNETKRQWYSNLFSAKTETARCFRKLPYLRN